MMRHALLALLMTSSLISQNVGIKYPSPNFLMLDEMIRFNSKFAPSDGMPYVVNWYEATKHPTSENVLMIVYKRPNYMKKYKNKIIVAYLLESGFVRAIDHFEVIFQNQNATYNDMSFKFKTTWTFGRTIYDPIPLSPNPALNSDAAATKSSSPSVFVISRLQQSFR